tara:strand:+ start:177 stop:809 length:633 start_codon:yes stop_codon:yes gene_type:complete
MSVNSFFTEISCNPKLPKLSGYSFSNIIDLPKNVLVHDFTNSNSIKGMHNPYSIGKYNEKRPNIYKGELFEKTNRFIHMGIDIGAPIGTAVKSFFDGKILSFKYNHLKLDYGYTIITEHKFKDQSIYALYGHLSKSSITNKTLGQEIHTGEMFAQIGKEDENGGWPPHVHFQLSLLKPKKCNLPGVVSEKDRDIALKIFPDPRIVLGEIY